MVDRMWTYPELRYIFANRYRLAAAELALEVNREFHDGLEVRSVTDIQRIQRSKTIFNRSHPD